MKDIYGQKKLKENMEEMKRIVEKGKTQNFHIMRQNNQGKELGNLNYGTSYNLNDKYGEKIPSAGHGETVRSASHFEKMFHT